MIGIKKSEVSLLRCPSCFHNLAWTGSDDQSVMTNGVLECEQKHIWRVKEAIPNLANRSRLSTKDQLLDVVYDFLAPVHDLSVDYLLPVLQYPDMQSSRDNYIKALKLKRNDVQKAAGPIRILEVGAGTGANLPLIRQRLRKCENVEIWAIDLNTNMIKGCAAAHQDSEEGLRLAIADAHSLPFADSTFDRVIHVGGINIYRDAKLGLEEMARVAKPETPIVVVDEGLDPDMEHNLLHKLAFRWLTSLDDFSKAPTDIIPKRCELVEVYNASRFYYCLVYQKLS